MPIEGDILAMTEVLRTADELEKDGFNVTLMYPGSRIRAFPVGVSLDRDARQMHLAERPYNLAIEIQRTDVMVVDIDSPEGMKFAQERGLISKMVVRTRRGLHSYLRHDIVEPRNTQNFRELGIDFLFNAAVPVPPAYRRDNQFVYQWQAGPVAKSELPVFDRKLLDEEPRRQIMPVVQRITDTTRDFARALCYATHQSVQGTPADSSGHRRMIWFASRMLKLFSSLTEEQLMAVLRAFNESKCSSSWSEAALLHKCKEAFKARGQS
ncbi:MAG: hypothetical protein ACJ8C4_16525 [Gemmataceae bacterium]